MCYLEEEELAPLTTDIAHVQKDDSFLTALRQLRSDAVY